LIFVEQPARPQQLENAMIQEPERDYDNHKFYKRPRAWGKMKEGIGQQFKIAELMSRMEEVADQLTGTPRPLLAAAMLHFVSASRDDQRRWLKEFYRYQNPEKYKDDPAPDNRRNKPSDKEGRMISILGQDWRLRVLRGRMKVNGQASAAHVDRARSQIDIADNGSRETLAFAAIRAGVACVRHTSPATKYRQVEVDGRWWKFRVLRGTLRVNKQLNAFLVYVPDGMVDVADSGSREQLAANAFRAGLEVAARGN
jgi:hypothetical protein